MMKQRKIKRRSFIVLAIVVVIVVCGAIGVNALRSSGMANPEAIPVGSVDISQVPNGVYHGEAKNGIVKVEVSVAVENGVITGIDILNHRTGKGKPAEVITEDVITAQSLEVDAISSATLSSKTILQAVENALTNGTT